MSESDDSIQIQHVGKAVFVRLEQEYDHARVVPELQRRLAEVIERDSPEVLLLDASETTWVNSTLLRTLLWAYSLRTRKGSFAVCGARPEFLVALERSGIAQVIKTYPSVEEAVRQLNAGGQDQPAKG